MRYLEKPRDKCLITHWMAGNESSKYLGVIKKAFKQQKVMACGVTSVYCVYNGILII